MDLSLSTASKRPGKKRYLIAGVGSVLIIILIGLGGYTAFHNSGSGSASRSPASLTPTPTAKLSSGYAIPLLGLGTYQTSGQATTDAVKSAISIGYRHIDTAEMYGNEAQVGQAISEAIEAGTINREDIFITTKLDGQHHARDAVVEALQISLEKLQLDYVDLFLIHWPVTDHPGPKLDPPAQDTWAGMEDAVDKGLARSIGVSNFSPEKITEWLGNARIPPAVNQVEMHPYWRNDRVLEYCRENNIHVTAYAPLSSPETMAKQGDHVPNAQKDPKIVELAESSNKTPQQVLLQWGLQHGDYQHVSVIPKSGNPDHQAGNFGALSAEDLSSNDFDTVSQISFKQRYFNGSGWAFSDQGPFYTYEDLWNESPDKQHP